MKAPARHRKITQHSGSSRRGKTPSARRHGKLIVKQPGGYFGRKHAYWQFLPAGLMPKDLATLPLARMSPHGCHRAGIKFKLVLLTLGRLARGKSLNRAARELRQPVASLFKNLAAWVRGGPFALIPETNHGRPALWKKHGITEHDVRTIAKLVQKGTSLSQAIRAYARKCPAALAHSLRTVSATAGFRAAVKRAMHQPASHVE